MPYVIALPPVASPATTAPGPPQVIYSLTGTKAPGDIITITYTDASGSKRTLRNADVPWSQTVTLVSRSQVGEMQASSLLMASTLNCSITTSEGTVLSSNASNAAEVSCSGWS